MKARICRAIIDNGARSQFDRTKAAILNMVAGALRDRVSTLHPEKFLSSGLSACPTKSCGLNYSTTISWVRVSPVASFVSAL